MSNCLQSLQERREHKYGVIFDPAQAAFELITVLCDDGIEYQDLLVLFDNDPEWVANFLNAFYASVFGINGPYLEVEVKEPEEDEYVDGRPVIRDGSFAYDKQTGNLIYVGCGGYSGTGGNRSLVVQPTDLIKLV
jgi:hypothetical protein